MRRAKVYWRGEQVGTLEAPDSFRPPITQAELDAIPAYMIGRSRSWLYDVRPLAGVADRERIAELAAVSITSSHLGSGLKRLIDRGVLVAHPDGYALA